MNETREQEKWREDGSKLTALIFMINSHFNRTLQYIIEFITLDALFTMAISWL